MSSSLSNPKKYEKFRKLLIESRLKQGVTQSELAKRLGRPQSFVSKYENGERRLDLIEFLEISSTLGIDPLDFIKELLSEKNS
jgi:transcriptional regulator with XRE-family HTH domain